MRRYTKAANLLACLILVIATLRAFAFWAADPMPAYANNYDQIRTLRIFGLHPKDSTKELYAGTPEQPWRYFVHADNWHAPTYPSSDLAFKFIQYGVMAVTARDDRPMDIKIGTIPILVGWMLCIWFLFSRLAAKPIATLGFACWMLLVADPINLLFLNTWYAEFSAFAVVTVFVGIAWLWLFHLISLRQALFWGALCLAIVSLNRNQYMFLLPAVALLAGTCLAWCRPYRRRLYAASGKLALVFGACLLPMLLFGSQAGQFRDAASANRVDTVFGALLPVSRDPAQMLKHLTLPEECLRFSGQTWYSIPVQEYSTHCPKIMALPLSKIANAVLHDPWTIAVIVGRIAQHHRGFLQNHLGHLEGTAFSKLDGDDRLIHRSLNAPISALSPSAATALIWLLSFGPAVVALIAWSLQQHRWAFMFALAGLLFNYALFSSILGDGYIEIERHAILCFSFGLLFFVLLVCFIPCSILQYRATDEPPAPRTT